MYIITVKCSFILLPVYILHISSYSYEDICKVDERRCKVVLTAHFLAGGADGLEVYGRHGEHELHRQRLRQVRVLAPPRRALQVLAPTHNTGLKLLSCSLVAPGKASDQLASHETTSGET